MNYIPLILPLLAILFLLPPVFRPGRDERAERESRLDVPRERRKMLVAALRELDFDHATGKLSDADHQAQRNRMKQEVALTIGEIEEEEGRVAS